jgi:hypothetical protein
MNTSTRQRQSQLRHAEIVNANLEAHGVPPVVERLARELYKLSDPAAQIAAITTARTTLDREPTADELIAGVTGHAPDRQTRNTPHEVTDTLDILKEAARIIYPGHGAWAYDTWLAHNTAYFNGILQPCGIQWGLTPHGYALGYFSPTFRTITLHTSLVNPHSYAWGLHAVLGEQFASDVLLHEMIHQNVHQEHGDIRLDGTSCHNNQAWCEHINRISDLLGLNVKAAVVKQRRENGSKPRWLPQPGYLSIADLAHWPHSVRPAGFYEAEAEQNLEKALSSNHA